MSKKDKRKKAAAETSRKRPSRGPSLFGLRRGMVTRMGSRLHSLTPHGHGRGTEVRIHVTFDRHGAPDVTATVAGAVAPPAHPAGLPRDTNTQTIEPDRLDAATPGSDEQPEIPTADGTGIEELASEYGPPALLNAKDEPSTINTLFFAAKYARDTHIVHDPIQNQFNCYDAKTGLWKPKTEARLLVDLGLAMRTMLCDCGCGALQKKCTGGVFGQVLRLVKGIAERSDAFRHERQIIHVGNGVLDLEGSVPSLRGFAPDYYSRNSTGICFVKGATCPRFINELLRPALGEADISLLQRYAGQCLLGHNISQKILLIQGTSGGGKSTFVNVIEAIVGLHNVEQLRVEHLAGRFELAGYDGKTLLCAKDVPGDFLSASSVHVLKALVGGDRLRAERKGSMNRPELLGDYNVIIASNPQLRVHLDADADAWRRRLLVVKYEKPATAKPIASFDSVLVKTEGSGILNWCIAGARRLLDEMNEHGGIKLTGVQTRRVDALLDQTSRVRHFVAASVVQDEAAEVRVRLN